ncbi:hypothetical protein P4476_12015 [Ureibacillus terrenus]|nr:hypothetical protein [Ureibacillus terrenus]
MEQTLMNLDQHFGGGMLLLFCNPLIHQTTQRNFPEMAGSQSIQGAGLMQAVKFTVDFVWFDHGG